MPKVPRYRRVHRGAPPAAPVAADDPDAKALRMMCARLLLQAALKDSGCPLIPNPVSTFEGEDPMRPSSQTGRAPSAA